MYHHACGMRGGGRSSSPHPHSRVYCPRKGLLPFPQDGPAAGMDSRVRVAHWCPVSSCPSMQPGFSSGRYLWPRFPTQLLPVPTPVLRSFSPLPWLRVAQGHCGARIPFSRRTRPDAARGSLRPAGWSRAGAGPARGADGVAGGHRRAATAVTSLRCPAAASRRDGGTALPTGSGSWRAGSTRNGNRYRPRGPSCSAAAAPAGERQE